MVICTRPLEAQRKISPFKHRLKISLFSSPKVILASLDFIAALRSVRRGLGSLIVGVGARMKCSRIRKGVMSLPVAAVVFDSLIRGVCVGDNKAGSARV